MRNDAEQVARLARARAARLEAAARAAAPPRGAARVIRILARIRLGLVRHARALVREHWDLGLFDLAFGSLKAFGVYPALFFAGLGWTIPLLEYAPLNTQLWTAGYLLARRKVLSAAGRVRYGRSGAELDALRARLLPSTPGPDHALHRFTLDGAERALRVRRSRLGAWWDRVRRRAPARGSIELRALRGMLDPELRFRAEPLRTNAYLYERVVIEALLATAAGRAQLAAASLPAPRECPTFGTLLADPEPTRARIEAQHDRLRTLLSDRTGPLRSWTARGLLWLHASLRRAVRRRLARLVDLEYRLLAALACGADAARHPAALAIRTERAAIDALVQASGQLVGRAARVRREDEAWRLLAAGVRDARARGLATRRAGLVLDRSLGRSPGWRAEHASVLPRAAARIRA